MKVLVIQQRMGIGDMVIYLPYIHAISKKYNCPISILAKKNSKIHELCEDDNHINEIIFLDNGSLRYKLLCKIAGIKNIYQYPLFRKKDNIVLSAKNFVDFNINENVSTQPELVLNEKSIIASKEKYEFNKNQKHICIGFSASGPTKRWDIEKKNAM